MGAIKDRLRFYRQAYEPLKPGGWIQHLDMSISFTSDDGSVAGDHILRQWSQTFANCGERTGKTFLITSKAAEWIWEVGFEDVQEKWYKVPVGTWSKDEGCCGPYMLIADQLAKADIDSAGSQNDRLLESPLVRYRSRGLGVVLIDKRSWMAA